MSNKDEYRKLCLEEPSIPIFSRDWWLDAVCGDNNWDVILVFNNKQIVASMPYYIKTRLGFKLMVQPQLTQKLGPWIRPSNGKYVSHHSHEMKIMTALIDQIPKYDYFNQDWHYTYTNWLPFYWRGFQQTTYYTYVINELHDLDQIWLGIKNKRRQKIKKAIDRFGISTRDDLVVGEFISLNAKTFRRKGKDLPYPTELVYRIDDACGKRSCRRIFVAEDYKGRQHAALMLIWDENSAYVLMSGIDPDLHYSGAKSLILWEAIKYSSEVTKVFDFEGSVNQSINTFNRSFGAVQVPCFKLRHFNSHILQVQQLMVALKRGNKRRR